MRANDPMKGIHANVEDEGSFTFLISGLVFLQIKRPLPWHTLALVP